MQRAIAAVICCTVVAAHADPRQDARLRAEQLEQTAVAGHDAALFVACGNAFLDVVRLAPTASDADEAAYNAGVCFEQGRSPDAATAAFHTVIAGFPRSRLASKAMARTARIAAQVGKLDEAASLLETYARLYAGEREAREASSDAAYYRQVLGDDSKTIEDVKFFVRMFQASDDDKAAAMFALTPVYERRGLDDAIKHLRGYLEQYGARGGQPRLVVVYARLGGLLWQKACPVKPTDGLCIKPSVASSLIKRDAKLANEAASAFAGATRAFDQLPSPDPAAVHAHAMAQLAAADRQLEAQDNAKAEAAYRTVIATADPSAVVAASARLARLAEPSPHVLELYAACVAKASELAVHDEWSQLCKRRRAELDPVHFTAHDEVLPDPVMIWPDVSADAVTVADGDPEPLRAAVAEFATHERSGWNPTTCRQSADRFAAIARISTMATYMAGLSYARCELDDDARAAYRRAGDDGSLVNLGALDWRAGNGAAAEKTWRELLGRHPDVSRAHLGVAIALFTRAHGDRTLERDGEAQLALARLSDLAPAYIVAAIRDRGLPAVADYELHLASDAHDESIALDVALGARAIERGVWPFALDRLRAAVALRGAPDEARLDLAIALLAVDRFDDASAQLAAIAQPTYDVLVARGIALRGQGKLAEADAAYARAIALEPTRTLALYDRDILVKEYVARRSP